MQYEKKIFGINVNLMKMNSIMGRIMNVNDALSKSFVCITTVLLAALLLYAVDNVEFSYMSNDVLIIPALLFVIVTLVYCLSKLVNRLTIGGVVLIPAVVLSISFLFIIIQSVGSTYNSPYEIRIMYEVYSTVLLPYTVYLLGFGIVKSILERIAVYGNAE